MHPLFPPFIFELHFSSLQLPMFPSFQLQEFGEWAACEHFYVWLSLSWLSPFFLSSKQEKKAPGGMAKLRILFPCSTFLKHFPWRGQRPKLLIFFAPCPSRHPLRPGTISLTEEWKADSSFSFGTIWLFLLPSLPLSLLFLLSSSWNTFSLVSPPENISHEIICQDGFGLKNKILSALPRFPGDGKNSWIQRECIVYWYLRGKVVFYENTFASQERKWNKTLEKEK